MFFFCQWDKMKLDNIAVETWIFTAAQDKDAEMNTKE